MTDNDKYTQSSEMSAAILDIDGFTLAVERLKDDGDEEIASRCKTAVALFRSLIALAEMLDTELSTDLCIETYRYIIKEQKWFYENAVKGWITQGRYGDTLEGTREETFVFLTTDSWKDKYKEITEDTNDLPALSDELEETYGECLGELFKKSEEEFKKTNTISEGLDFSKDRKVIEEGEFCVYGGTYCEECGCHFVFETYDQDLNSEVDEHDFDAYQRAILLHKELTRAIEESKLHRLGMEVLPSTCVSLFHVLARHEHCILWELFQKVGGWFCAASDDMEDEVDGTAESTFLFLERDEFLKLYKRLMETKAPSLNGGGFFVGFDY